MGFLATLSDAMHGVSFNPRVAAFADDAVAAARARRRARLADGLRHSPVSTRLESMNNWGLDLPPAKRAAVRRAAVKYGPRIIELEDKLARAQQGLKQSNRRQVLAAGAGIAGGGAAGMLLAGQSKK